MSRKAKLEKALKLGGVASAEYRGAKYVNGSPGFETARSLESWLQAEYTLKFENKRLASLHSALLDAVEALEELQLGHSHKSGDEHFRLLGDNYGWCSFCQTKVSFGPGIAEEALSKIDKVLGDGK